MAVTVQKRFVFFLITSIGLCVSVLHPTLAAAQAKQHAFTVVPLGVKGGLDEGNLSSYLIAAAGTTNYACLDAGTVRTGLDKAVAKGILKSPATTVLKENIKAFLISHPHLDHLAGLVLNSPDDSAKPILGLPLVIDAFKQHYFTWQTWANFGNEGQTPILKKYQYVPLQEGRDTSIQGTAMKVKALPLSHAGKSLSTAFIISHNNNYVAYLGDTGPDSVEQSKQLGQLWQTLAPLIKRKALRGIFIEVSYNNQQPDSQLFGHLTPRWLMKELSNLATLTDPAALKNLPVIITHSKNFGSDEVALRRALRKANILGVKLIFPEQATLFYL